MSLPLPEQPSRNRSASTGDSGLPRHEHKRPRLSGGQESSQKALTITTGSGSKMASTKPMSISASHTTKYSNSALVSPPESPLPSPGRPDVTSPQSKVTINTRPISSQSGIVAAQPPSSGASGGEKPEVSSNTESVSIQTSTSSRQQAELETISISSSEHGSPIIQVAIPQDLDQDAVDTQWEPMPSPTEVHAPPIQPGHVQCTFPYTDQANRPQAHAVVTIISKIFSEGGSNEGEVFQKVKDWCVDLSTNIDTLTYDFLDEDREIWLKFPGMMASLLKRKTEPPADLALDDLVTFYTAYARIATFFVEADTARLQSYTEATDPKTIVNPRCMAFLPQLQWMMISESMPLYDSLAESHNYSPSLITDMVMDQFLNSQAIKHVQSLTALFHALAELLPTRPALFDTILSLVSHAGGYVGLLADRAGYTLVDGAESNTSFSALMAASSEFLNSINALLDRAITKQQPWLNIDTCEKMFRFVVPFVGALSTSFPQIAVDIVVVANVTPSNFNDIDLASLAPLAWRFSTLQRFIKKARMEVRVACVQIMAGDLVDAYQEHIKAFRDLEHPKVQFLTQFIRNNDIIRYIIGVDSHPQIIERCANIIGFLCVSQTYRNEDTDAIWQTVLESQDPRTVVALLGVFGNNFDNLEIDVLCYIVHKMLIVPYERVDAHMLDFAVRLIHTVTLKTSREFVSSEDEAEVDQCIVSICLKLLRGACTPDHMVTELSFRIRVQVSDILAQRVKVTRGCLQSSDDTVMLDSVLISLCRDLSNHNEYASGSTLALRTILSAVDEGECTRIVEQYEVSSLLMDDLAFTCNNKSKSGMEEVVLCGFGITMDLMITLIFRASHTFTDALILRMWTDVLSSPNLNTRLRSYAWNSLATIFEACRTRNSTLDKITEHYLPTIETTLYDSAILQFVVRSVRYETRFTASDPMDSSLHPSSIVIIPGIERVWKMMLDAPPNTIELMASDFIIEQYLDGERVLQKNASHLEATHLALIDRCVKQVIDAAAYLQAIPDIQMADSTPNLMSNSSEAHDMKFHRSILFLRRFLDNLKMRPRFAPAANDNLQKALNTLHPRGSTFEVTLQIINHKSLASIQLRWVLGYDNSGGEIWQFLSDLTGWSQFVVINGGKRIQLRDEQKSLKDLGLMTGSFMINRIQGSPEGAPAKAVEGSSPVDNKIMHHFDELYKLLELEDQFAKEVFDFLSMFSSQEEVVQNLKSMTISADNLLPVEKPFKLMYYARALTSCIEEESFSSEPHTEFLVYGMKTILTVLPRLNQLQAELTTCISIAQGLVEALILALRARVPPNVSASYIPDAAAFGDILLSLWVQALDVSKLEAAQANRVVLIKAPFEALIEGLLHDERIWSSISEDRATECLEKSLLANSSQEVRQGILSIFLNLTGVVNSKLSFKSNESRSPRTRFSATTIENILGHLWKILVRTVDRADANAGTCEEYFEALSAVLRQYQRKLTEEDLSTYVEEWKCRLLTHQHHQVIGQNLHDFYILSLGKVLLQVLKAAPQHDLLANHESFVRDLFEYFLFPVPRSSHETTLSKAPASNSQHDPVLDMHTRWTLYELVLVLTKDRRSLEILCDELNSDLIPKDLYFQPNTNNDRQSLRSAAGYSGLRNLSNTCYLNSLFSQLFMNVEFRELVMNVNIIDRSKQKLVAELGKVFASMQMSYEDAVSPENAVDSITLWDGDQIDVTVQMDVDEFFNLLFDRLEPQIVDPKICNKFKSIYGGQLVQQIKSQECEHVSERLEPFATVQVEIKGKTSLEESLRAYVEGEVLQGENKYSCTSCGKHVNAVKRACLKSIPNHLIFNLKRFDYDIMTGMRCKVNDEFGFPEEIDMAPYTLEALSKPDQPVQKDIFELVGIIIHSGTAESGHYYSYIRQRPSSLSKEKSWVQFNDHDVTHFDPASIRECCFGGIDFGAVQCPKFYNGYMLFYQRASSIQEFQRKYPDETFASSVRLNVDPDVSHHISQYNDMFLRSYVAQDPTHAKFMRCLLQQAQNVDELKCSPKHRLSCAEMLLITMNYLNQMSARWKDLPEVEETFTLLRAYASECSGCAQELLRWMVRDDHLADNLLRSCYMLVRKSFALLILTCWNKWTKSVLEDQQSSDNAPSRAADRAYMSFVHKFLVELADGWELLQRHPRAWDQYFPVVNHFLQNDDATARAVVEAGFLELTLELIHVHVLTLPSSKRLRLKYGMYLLARERNRPFAHNLLIRFFADLIQHVDLVTPVSDYEDRILFGDRVSPSMQEAALLGLTAQPANLPWLKKIIYGRCNPQIANLLVAHLCHTRQFDGVLCNTLKEGLGDRQLFFATACLPPTITFISHCTDGEIVKEAVSDALDSIETTSGQYSKEYLSFVQEVAQISNEEASIPPGGLKYMVTKYIPSWAPVLLMAPNETNADVRAEALELVNDVLFQEMGALKQGDIHKYRQYIGICKSLAKACATYAEAAFINARTPSLYAGQANQACQVIDLCLGLFGESAADEDEASRITAVMEEFRARAEGIVDTVTDVDWNASSDLEAMSEVDNMSDTSN